MGVNTSSPQMMGAQGAPRVTGINRYSHTFLLPPDIEHVAQREKKKKASKFATLRKRFTRSRRQSKSFDHARVIRDLLSTWAIRDVHALVEEYEASIALKELSTLANISRPHSNTFKEDLSNLYDYKYCTDVDLVYKGVVFPVHRAILSVRCPYFRNMFNKVPEYGVQVPVTIRTPGVDVNMFSALLRYLYTGEFDPKEIAKIEKADRLIRKLAEEFGTPNPLEDDLRNLLETGMYSDALLIFTTPESESPHDPATPDSVPDSHGSKQELRCHKAILAARSPFFRNLLMRRARTGEELTERALRSPTCIVLDEMVIPRRYARVLLHAIYLDAVDLNCIVRNSVSMCSLSEVQAMVAGRSHMTLVEEAMEIYQIGQFLDFGILSQGCEDIIAESLAIENFVAILNWSSQAHGSNWVYRQGLQFLREEFLQVSHSTELSKLSEELMIKAIQSDFLQASELDVLTTVLKWGEYQLVKRIEEREPNLLSHTAHSVSKKGVKKRDLNDLELRDILVELLPHIRSDHIIPHNNETLHNAIKRGLISVPPSHMIGEDSFHSTASAWVRTKTYGMFVKPRLFLPYYEEAKSLLEDQQNESNEQVRLRMVPMCPIPDTLYMVDDQGLYGSIYSPTVPPSTFTVDIIAGTVPVPDQECFKAMIRRESELNRTKLVQRAYKLPKSDHRAVSHEVQLRIVREFGLPDSTVEVLKSSQMHHCKDSAHITEGASSGAQYHTPRRMGHHHVECIHQSPHHHSPQPGSPMYNSYPRLCHHHHSVYGESSSHAMSASGSPNRSYNSMEKPPSVCSDTLNENIPDIAMASSSLSQLTLHASSSSSSSSSPQHLAPPDLQSDLQRVPQCPSSADFPPPPPDLHSNTTENIHREPGAMFHPDLHDSIRDIYRGGRNRLDLRANFLRSPRPGEGRSSTLPRRSSPHMGAMARLMPDIQGDLVRHPSGSAAVPQNAAPQARRADIELDLVEGHHSPGNQTLYI